MDRMPVREYAEPRINGGSYKTGVVGCHPLGMMRGASGRNILKLTALPWDGKAMGNVKVGSSSIA